MFLFFMKALLYHNLTSPPTSFHTSYIVSHLLCMGITYSLMYGGDEIHVLR